MRISEIFLSIQGEGIEQGNPTIFIRTFGCTQKTSCRYCDTLYSVKGDDYKNLSLQDILKKVNSFLPYYYICLTGGDPLAQEPDSQELTKLLLRNKKTIWLETNGIKNIKWYTRQGDRCRVVMDIKCPSSGNKDNTYWRNIKYLRKIDQVKFVIGTEADYNYAKAIAQTLSYTSPVQILFSSILYPVKAKMKPDKLVKKILKDQLFVRYSLQIHKFIYDPGRRGV